MQRCVRFVGGQFSNWKRRWLCRIGIASDYATIGHRLGLPADVFRWRLARLMSCLNIELSLVIAISPSLQTNDGCALVVLLMNSGSYGT